MASYTIQSGDTLNNIATKNNTSVANLMSLNPSITDPNKIQAGQNLNLGGVSAPTPSGSLYSAPTPTGLPIGVKATSPTSNITAPATTLPALMQDKASASPTSSNGLMGGLISSIGGYSTIPGPYDAVTGQLKSTQDTQTNANTVNPTTAPVSYTANNDLYGQLITGLANMSQQPGSAYTTENAAANATLQQLKDLQNDYAQKTNNIGNTAGFLTQQNGEQGLLQNQYNQGVQALSSQYTGETNQLGAANTQQGLLQAALTAAAGGAAPVTQFGVQTSPITGQPISGGSATQAAINGGSIQGAQNAASTLSAQYQTGLTNLQAANGIQNQIVSTLNANPTLNNTPVSALTNLNELLSGQVSSGPQQLLSQQIAQYISTLGLDPATVTSIASQQQGTLAQLLDSLYQTAQTKVNALNPNNIQPPAPTTTSNTNSGSTSSSTSTSGFGWNG